MQMNSTYNYFEFKSIDTFNYAAGMNLFCLINGMPRETIKSLYREQNIYHEWKMNIHAAWTLLLCFDAFIIKINRQKDTNKQFGICIFKGSCRFILYPLKHHNDKTI